MGLRPARCYRRIERPYTRVSRRREKAYVRGVPGSKIVHFNMGNPNGKFEYVLKLISKQDVQVRHNALEAARIAANRILSKLGNDNYYFWIKVYPHHVLRENPLATGAGADRLQQGMRLAFGKPIGRAAQVEKGQEVMLVFVNEKGLETAKQALKQANYKLPFKGQIVIEKVTTSE